MEFAVALLAALVALNFHYLILLDRRDKRERVEREQERDVVDRLLQRIQAPETAVAMAYSPMPDLPAVHPDRDEEYWDAQEQALRDVQAIERGEA